MGVDTKLVCLAGILLFAVGSILPWASMNDGKTMAGFSTPVFPVAAFLAAIAVLGINTEFKFSDTIALAASGLAFAIVLYTFFTTQNLAPGAAHATVEYGLMISMLGSLVLCVSTVMGKGRY